jgi:hypothetical protein
LFYTPCSYVPVVNCGNANSGVVVVFEHVSPKETLTGVSAAHNNKSQHSSSKYMHRPTQLQQRELLVCETSRELKCYSELFVEPVLVDAATGGGAPLLVEGTVDSKEGVHNYSFIFLTCFKLSHSFNPIFAGHLTYRSCEWEVFPDAWITSELDFLEGYIV